MNEKFSALKNAQGTEDALVERYKQLIDEIIKTKAISDERKIGLINYGNLAIAALPPKKVHFNPHMQNPKGTLSSASTFIGKFIRQFAEEQRMRPDNVPTLSVDQVINSIKEAGIEIIDTTRTSETGEDTTVTTMGGMEIKKLKNVIKGIIDTDEWRRAEEKGLGFDDSELVAEAEQAEAKSKLAFTPHPPSQPSSTSILPPIRENTENTPPPPQKTTTIASKFAVIKKLSKQPPQEEEGENDDKLLKPN